MCRARIAAAAWTLALLVGALPAGTRGAEPFHEFVDALRQRGYFDAALDYLDRAGGNRLINEADRQSALFEAGRTLVEQAQVERDFERRLEQLDAARQRFEKFRDQHPEHPLAAGAGLQLGDVLLERGRAEVDRAVRRPTEAEREAGWALARPLFEAAQSVFSQSEGLFDERFRAFPTTIDSKHPEQVAAKRQAQHDLIAARLKGAQVLYEAAQAFAPGSAEARQRLEQAAEKNGALYQDYRRVLAGLIARMRQGRCQQELGHLKQALAYYGELLDQPDDKPDLRILRTTTLRMALECWLSPNENKVDEVIRRGTDWLAQARPDEARTSDGLAIRWHTADAWQRRGQALGENDPQRGNTLDKAVDLAEVVAATPGEHQRAAQELQSRLRGGKKAAPAATFAEARDQAKAALDAMETQQAQLEANRLLPEAAAEGEAQLREQIQASATGAWTLFRRALVLADQETPLDELNQARYFTCYLAYRQNRFEEALVLGEFLARHYADSAVGRPGVGLALASYVQGYNAAAPADRSVFVVRLTNLAEFVASHWPQSDDADKARMLLADMALRAGDLEQVLVHLEQVRADSPRRGEADLKVGQARWSLHLARLRLPEAERPAPDVAEAQLTAARVALERGLAAAHATGNATGAVAWDAGVVAAGELSLAQILVAQSQFTEAMAVLERAETGPLALVTANHPLAAQGNFAVETYKATLQALVATQQLERAEATMQALDARSTAGGDSAESLTRIYVSLGRELEEQVGRLRATNQTEQLTRVLRSFELFLEKIAARESGNTFQTLNWVAETLLAMGTGLDAGDAQSTAARAYYEKAAKVYTRLSQRVRDEPGFAPTGDVQTGLTVRLARCDRLLGNHRDAIDTLVEVLKRQPATLDAQLEAARAYQAWGHSESKYYAAAIHGDRAAKKKDGSVVNIVWGWRKLATALQGRAEFQEIFHDAYFHLAETAWQQAQSSAPPQRQQALASVEALLLQLARSEPELGGPHWRPRFERLLAEVRQGRAAVPSRATAVAPGS